MKKPKLKRELGLFEVTMYGLGIIIGAGVYALIGEGAGIAGNAIWMSFIIGAVIASFTGLSYCELSSMIPKEAAEYNYTKKAFGKRLAFIVGWSLIVANIIGAAAVAMGFGGYFSHIFSTPIIPVAVILIVLLSLLNFWSLKESSHFNIVAATLEMVGLFIIIAIGVLFFRPNVDYFYSPAGITSVLSGTALVFFAFLGFENLANISEETKKARKVIPKAMLLSIAITTILYIAVAAVAVGAVGWEALSSSKAPLSLVMNQALGQNASLVMSIIALFSTSNTVLIMLIAVSRMIYGMASQGSLPKLLGKIHKKRHTPYKAVFLVMITASIMTLVGDIGIVAELTTIGIFAAFIAVNASAIVLRYKLAKARRPFKMPLNIGKFPVLALLGVVTSAAMLFYFKPVIWLAELAILMLGLLIYEWRKK
ncbi:MAG: amino acid permease [Candidatus Aenigmarchaeota archaeon]|nr:amino acid permease [Candidatus Aenigmarchaeota archaeon]